MNLKKIKIGLLNYKCGNINSLSSVFDYLNCESIIINNNNIQSVENITHLVLPGVGSYGYCIKNLKKSKLNIFLNNFIKKKLPTLSICVGMQLLGKKSEESPNVSGLGILNYDVVKFNNKNLDIKIPHVGWNSVQFKKNIGKFKKNLNYDFYFDHSFYVTKNSSSIGKTKHGQDFCSVIENGNILSCQFHPEKSQENGIKFLEYFISK